MAEQPFHKCSDCGAELKEGALSCPECGCPVTSISTNDGTRTQSIREKLRIVVAVVLCLIACFCVYKCFYTINDDGYKFYKEHYSECMEGYAESTANASSYSYGFFKSSYQDIANQFLDMANDDMKEIWQYRTKMIVFGVSGASLLIMAVFLLCHRKKR